LTNVKEGERLEKMLIRPEILSNLFTDLAAGWLGLILVTPAAISSERVEEIVVSITRALLGAVISLLTAEFFARKAGEYS
jgi:hypothetical protein